MWENVSNKKITVIVFYFYDISNSSFYLNYYNIVLKNATSTNQLFFHLLISHNRILIRIRNNTRSWEITNHHVINFWSLGPVPKSCLRFFWFSSGYAKWKMCDKCYISKISYSQRLICCKRLWFFCFIDAIGNASAS